MFQPHGRGRDFGSTPSASSMRIEPAGRQVINLSSSMRRSTRGHLGQSRDLESGKFVLAKLFLRDRALSCSVAVDKMHDIAFVLKPSSEA